MVTTLCIFKTFVNNYNVFKIIVLSNINGCCLSRIIYVKYYLVPTHHWECMHSVICKTDAHDIFVSSVKNFYYLSQSVIKLSSIE